MNHNQTVIVRLVGGLGNQLFQLQFGQTFSKLNSSKMLVDDSFLQASRKSHEVLSCDSLLDESEIVTLSKFHLRTRRCVERLFFKLDCTLPRCLGPMYIFENERPLSFRSQQFIIDGFWQDKKYLNKDFIEYVRIKMLNIQHWGKNCSTSEVCVHVRRGDYLTNKNWFALAQSTVPVQYYLDAFEFMYSCKGLRKFHLYTDDEPWAQSVFGCDERVEIIKSSNFTSVELLTRMSQYYNYIIANSTLSWWAAVLSPFSSKVVVLPKQWSVKMNSDKYKLDGWVQI